MPVSFYRKKDTGGSRDTHGTHGTHRHTGRTSDEPHKLYVGFLKSSSHRKYAAERRGVPGSVSGSEPPLQYHETRDIQYMQKYGNQIILLSILFEFVLLVALKLAALNPYAYPSEVGSVLYTPLRSSRSPPT